MSITEFPPSPIDANTQVRDGRDRDSFGRGRVSEPKTISDIVQRFNARGLHYEKEETAGGTSTYILNESLSRMRVAASGDKVIRQTFKYMEYQPGKGQVCVMTTIAAAGETGLRQRWGYHDEDDGVYVEDAGNALFVVLRTSTSGSAVNERVAQASWSEDTLDGSADDNNPSGLTLDITKNNIYWFDLQWLSAGRVRCGVEIDGVLIYFHHFNHANDIALPYMKTAMLPVRWEIEATGAISGNLDMKQICSTVFSEGGHDPEGQVWTADNGITSVSAGTTLVPIVSIRLDSANLKMQIELLRMEMSMSTKKDVRWAIVLNGTLTGASWADKGGDAVTEVDVAATAIAGGQEILSGYLNDKTSTTGGTPLGTTVPIGAAHLGTPTADIVSLCAQAFATTAAVFAALTYRENF